jgi:hypothetical protein
LNGLPCFERELRHELHQIERAVDRGRVLIGQYIRCGFNRDVSDRSLRSPQVVDEPVARDGIDPG